MNRLILGTRGSKLAMIQTESVVAGLRQANPDLEISIRKITTAGDLNRRERLDRMGTGAFVKELESALIDGQIDIAVHSLKDMPTDLPSGLCLAAVTARLDPRDVLVARVTLDNLPPGARIGTGSVRRAAQLNSYLPDLKALPIRGNIDTRLRKVAGGEFDGVLLAAAALLRLGWSDKITEYLPLDPFLPAAGQGALATEARRDDTAVVGLVSPLNHPPSWQCVTAERALLSALGGGCRAPIATLGTVNGATLKLEGMVASTSGEKILRASAEGSAVSPEDIGERLAQKLLAMGAAGLIEEAEGK